MEAFHTTCNGLYFRVVILLLRKNVSDSQGLLKKSRPLNEMG